MWIETSQKLNSKMKLNLIVIILDGKAVTRMQEKRILVTDLSNGVFPVSFTSNKVLQED